MKAANGEFIRLSIKLVSPKGIDDKIVVHAGYFFYVPSSSLYFNFFNFFKSLMAR